MELDKIRSSPKLPELVIRTLFNAITNGDIKVNQELQSERELSEKLGVSRGSLREGLSILEFLGVITSQGNRKIVTRNPESIEKVVDVIKLSRQKDIVIDFLEFRRAIEPFGIKLACKRATDEDIARIEEAVINLQKDADDLDADYMFHKRLAEASHNSFLAALLELSISMLDSVRQRSIKYPGRREMIVKEHREILEAVKQRNGELAEVKILNHLKNIEATLRITEEYLDLGKLI